MSEFTRQINHRINLLMRAACKEAVKYGDALIPMERNPTLVTVILNPVANKRRAKRDYEKYCEPLLLLAGLQVEVIQTKSEGNAKEIVESLRGTEAIIIAGGDGTLSESITGLLRRNDEANRFPLGILPLGSTNSLGNALFPGGDGVDKVKQLIQACMAIIEGNTEWKDAIKIEPLSNEGEAPSRPIYAMTSIEWGAFRDIHSRKDKYWIYGPLREYASYVFNGYKDSITWDCSGSLKYSPLCAGCSNCVTKRPEIKRKWTFFIPETKTLPESDKTQVLNPECSILNELCFKTSEFKINPQNINGLPGLGIHIGKNKYTYTEFVSEGWRRLKGKNESVDTIKARTIELLPHDPKPDTVIEIDQEDFEVKPVKITILPKIVKFYCKPEIKV
ncbi:acylglycerol kinase, mitochondrial isoform X2 [Aricia agestis]|uniref:acylglycerol kinase, mitochondrial isoform X2 n=1 Tax=Aricia agestis TaxID=91739 RepID=UPI001C2094FC|nr:acylglycerol kinase, mitochondrial isoform X2 [Aricia agestis]